MTRTSFTDAIAKRKIAPGAGHYKDTDRGFKATRQGTFDTLIQ